MCDYHGLHFIALVGAYYYEEKIQYPGKVPPSPKSVIRSLENWPTNNALIARRVARYSCTTTIR